MSISESLREFHANSLGNGEPLVMLHGWGMHSGIWGKAVEQLAQHFRVHCVDLPGHGCSKEEKGEGRRGNGQNLVSPFSLPPSPFPLSPSPFSLDFIAGQLSAQFAGPISVCGWSLGGQVALRWAQQHPDQVRKLVLVASTPCFTQRADWRCAIANEVLQEFASSLARNYPLTIKRFIALQVRGSENERELLQEMRERMSGSGEPDMAVLRAGLEILRDTDLRGELAQIAQPVLVVAGERDTLTPPGASAYLAQALPDARLAVIKGAAHAPFLSHPEEFVKQVNDFLKG